MAIVEAVNYIVAGAFLCTFDAVEWVVTLCRGRCIRAHIFASIVGLICAMCACGEVLNCARSKYFTRQVAGIFSPFQIVAYNCERYCEFGCIVC